MSKTRQVKLLQWNISIQLKESSKKECLHELKSSNLVIGIYGERYGSIDKDTNLSMTEVEFDYAVEHDIPLLALVMRTPNRERREKGVIENKVFNRGLHVLILIIAKSFSIGWMDP